jgi:hypothetical protein
MAKRKTSRAKKSKSSAKNKSKKKPAARIKPARVRRPARSRTAPNRARSTRARAGIGEVDITLPPRPGTGPSAGGQSGDIEDLPDTARADSESVEELAAEGQDFEAEIVDAVEGAPDPDESEVKTREVPENDVPDEYEDDQKPGRFTR